MVAAPGRLEVLGVLLRGVMTTVLLGCALFVQADDWPMAGHDPMRTGCSKEYLGGPFGALS